MLGNLKIEKYLDWGKKEELINQVLLYCIEKDDGLYKCDSMKKEFYFCVYVIANYTDYPFRVDQESKYTHLVDDFDNIMRQDLYHKIIEEIGNDYYYLLERLEESIEYKLKENSVESVINRLGIQLINKIDDYMSPKGLSRLSKAVEKINPEIKKIVSEMNKSK